MKKIIYIVSALVLMAGSSSCVGDLDQYPHSTYTANDVFTSADGYQQVLGGIYAAFIQRISSVGITQPELPQDSYNVPGLFHRLL